MASKSIERPHCEDMPGRNTALPSERLAKVDELLRMCVPRETIAVRLAKEWGLKPGQVRRYIATVIARWRAEREARNPDEEKEQIRLSLCTVITKAFAKGELKTAIIGLDRLAKLGGHYVDRVEITGGGGRNFLMGSDEETVKRRIRELYEKHAAQVEAATGKLTPKLAA